MVKSYELFEKKQNEKGKKCDHVTGEFMLSGVVPRTLKKLQIFDMSKTLREPLRSPTTPDDQQ